MYIQIIYAVIIKHQPSRSRSRSMMNQADQTQTSGPKPTMTGKCRWGTEMWPVRERQRERDGERETHQNLLPRIGRHVVQPEVREEGADAALGAATMTVQARNWLGAAAKGGVVKATALSPSISGEEFGCSTQRSSQVSICN